MYEISIDEKDVADLFGEDSQLAALLTSMCNQILKAQQTEYLGAQPYERTAERKGYRNGTQERTLYTRVGELNILVPRIRDGEFSQDLFARMQRSDQALVQAMMEMVVNGVSTRKVTRITEELCGVSFSKSMVSSLCSKWDIAIQQWNERDLGDVAYPFIELDGIYIKVREAGRVQSKCCCIAIGTNAHGIRSVLGVHVEDKESIGIWDGFSAWLEERHLHGVDLVTSDAHIGLVDAVKKHFSGATWQRCQVHMQRDIIRASPRSLQKEISHRYREIVDAPTEEKARILMKETLAEYETKASSAMNILENGFDDIMAVMTFPEQMRVHIRTSNGIERLNKEVRRRERVIGIFPNKDSAFRLLGAVLMEHDEIWSTKTHMNMADYHLWKAEQLTLVKSSEAAA